MQEREQNGWGEAQKDHEPGNLQRSHRHSERWSAGSTPSLHAGLEEKMGHWQEEGRAQSQSIWEAGKFPDRSPHLGHGAFIRISYTPVRPDEPEANASMRPELHADTQKSQALRMMRALTSLKY